MVRVRTRKVMMPVVVDGVRVAEVPTDLSEQCVTCRHWTANLQCEAFPELIPEDIRSGEFDHTNPHDGDGGIRYELDPRIVLD